LKDDECASVCHGSITEYKRQITDKSKGRGEIHKHQPNEHSSCDIHNRMGILLALKNNHALHSVWG